MNPLVPASNGNGHNGNGLAHVQPELPRVAYVPHPRDWKFLAAVQEAIAADGRLSHEAIANRLKVTRQAVTKRLNDADFADWINDQIAAAVDDAWPKVLMRATTLALKGSIDHMNFLAKVGGRFKQLDTAPGAGGGLNVQVNIHV